MSQYKYTVVTPHEDPKLAVIKKENLSVEFTLADLEADKKNAEKIRTQIVSQIELDKAQAQNVANNHPYVLEATEEEIKRAVAIALYNGMNNKVKESEAKLAEIDAVFVEHDTELADITEQTGIDLDVQTVDVSVNQNV